MKEMIQLEQLSIASPCRADWQQMSGDQRVRYCTQCERHVYNLSGMTRGEAQQLLAQNEGRVCVRFYRRFDGTVLTRDCPVGFRALRRDVAAIVGGTLMIAAILLSSLVTAVLSAGSRQVINRPTNRSTHWPMWMWQRQPSPVMGDCVGQVAPVNAPPASNSPQAADGEGM